MTTSETQSCCSRQKQAIRTNLKNTDTEGKEYNTTGDADIEK